MRLLACVLCALGLMSARGQELRNANFDIRFEPTAVLQVGAEIRFDITVRDAEHHAVHGAQVTLQIETAEHDHIKSFRATEMQTGLYMAKPIFPVEGQWNVNVEVHRADTMSARSIEYYVPNGHR